MPANAVPLTNKLLQPPRHQLGGGKWRCKHEREGSVGGGSARNGYLLEAKKQDLYTLELPVVPIGQTWNLRANMSQCPSRVPIIWVAGRNVMLDR